MYSYTLLVGWLVDWLIGWLVDWLISVVHSVTLILLYYVSFYPLLIYIFPFYCLYICWTGQLTVQGYVNHFQLGEYFRQRYIYQMQFLGKNFNSSEMYLRSTGNDSTITLYTYIYIHTYTFNIKLDINITSFHLIW